MSTSALGYLDRATKALSQLGFATKQNEELPIVQMMEELAAVDEQRTIIIARTLQQASFYNEVVRTQVADMNIGTRYEKINNLFDSIIQDAKNRIAQLDDGKIDTKEKLTNWVEKFTRGSINSRFSKIKTTYLDVAKDTKGQLDRENTILNAYLDFRGALKEAEILAAQMLKVEKPKLDAAALDLQAKAKAVTEVPAENTEERARAQLARDESQRAFDNQTRRYDLIKRISDNLTVSYNVGEVVVTKLTQTHSAKEAVYQQATIFFTTNESVFTSIDAAFSSGAGLHESTKALDAMTAGANKSLETLAEVTGKTEMAALKSAHGPTLQAQSVKKLVDAIVKFREESTKAIEQFRQEATKNATEIANIVDDGKKRYTEIIAAN